MILSFVCYCYSLKTFIQLDAVKIKGPDMSQNSHQLFLTRTIIDKTNRSWTTEQSFPLQIEPAQLVLSTLLPSQAPPVASNPVNGINNFGLIAIITSSMAMASYCCVQIGRTV